MADARIDAALAIVAVPLDRRLVWEALQAAGAVNDFIHGRLLPEGNKVLAGVGDRVLSLVITETARQDGVTIGRLQHLHRNLGRSDDIVRRDQHSTPEPGQK